MSPPTTESVVPAELKTTELLTKSQEKLDLKKLALEKGDYGICPDTVYPELEEFEFNDRGHHADLKKASLYDNAEKVVDLTPKIGTEIHGIQLSELTKQQKDDLALMAAERGVVFFTNQDIDVHQMLDLGKHYGPLYVHNTAPHPPSIPPVRIVYTDGKKRKADDIYTYYSNGDAWHTDMSFEKQPAGMSFLKFDICPPNGNEAMFASQYAAYDRLSPAMQKFVEGLEAVHTNEFGAKRAKASNRTIRRQHYQTTHPVVRTHPVTKWKSLFVQPLYTKSIVGLTRRESESMMGFLNNHIEASHDIQLRYRYSENTVAVWDNRITTHNAIFPDSTNSALRHGYRVITQAEKPYFDPNSTSKQDYYDLAAARNNI